ncbi:hypothetical protein P154DRAFT_579143 [Amniculicola lignicola CBS 123094]|uniref:Uncharacterized protein n=1 Tax=Amniculicola lignicola CBS 123094 TaxID=1392246 RepID=A0A6A5W8X6_9PLEO|nr:hypothetical protein P154DRAFT_579143 [Amniculicola lignicola CBS 123094]
MFGFLPLIPPRADASLWPSHRPNNPALDSPSDDSNSANGHFHRRPSSHHGRHHNSSRTMLAALTADENALYQRKQNVRRFGAGWIRPPGVSKTLQAKMDEEAEREEQEIIARREQGMLDLAAAQTEAANQEAAAHGEDEEMGEGERDLDEDVPEAEESEPSASEDEEESLVEGETTMSSRAVDVTFNEDSFLEGSMIEGVEQMQEMEAVQMAGILEEQEMERDLDDSIPEAGSYEHTDTEIDSSSDDGQGNVSYVSYATTNTRHLAPGPRSSARRSSGQSIGMGMEGSSSILDGSSFLRSSPAVSRAIRGARGGGARRNLGRGARGG